MTRCIVDCPDRGKCYLEHQAQCCPVFRVNCAEGEAAIKRVEHSALSNAKRADKQRPIPGAKERMAVAQDKLLPAFMKAKKLERLKEIYA